MLNVWSSTCAPCVAEAPLLEYQCEQARAGRRLPGHRLPGFVERLPALHPAVRRDLSKRAGCDRRYHHQLWRDGNARNTLHQPPGHRREQSHRPVDAAGVTEQPASHPALNAASVASMACGRAATCPPATRRPGGSKEQEYGFYTRMLLFIGNESC